MCRHAPTHAAWRVFLIRGFACCTDLAFLTVRGPIRPRSRMGLLAVTRRSTCDGRRPANPASFLRSVSARASAPAKLHQRNLPAEHDHEFNKETATLSFTHIQVGTSLCHGPLSSSNSRVHCALANIGQFKFARSEMHSTFNKMPTLIHYTRKSRYQNYQ